MADLAAPLTAKTANGTVAQIYVEVRKKRAATRLTRDLHTSLNSQVLVLNRLWQAVNICTARRAFALVYAGHAHIVSSDQANNFMTHDFESWRDLSANAPDHEVVTTISFKIRVPRVIVLLVFDRLPKKEVKFTRHNVFERDKNTCQYCGEVFERSDLNLDHVVPRDRGGMTTWENVVCSCIACNTRKGNRLPREAHMSLIRKPKRPKWRPFVQITFSAPQHDLWKHFVDLAYWNVELSD
ncbi:MAG: HNH endonuclease [Verrucomicrobia bacterium]|jgi:5-methylcytosine-specific restriction endonuclease McrA|nr:MAG: HNH endonuclease [Verrucomicrobiota bacterium]